MMGMDDYFLINIIKFLFMFFRYYISVKFLNIIRMNDYFSKSK